MKRLVLNGNENTDGCFPAVLFQMQRASVSLQCGDYTAVGGGNVTHNNISACAHKRKNNHTATSLRLPFQASECTHRSRHRDFWQWEIKNWGGKKSKIL